MPSLEFMREEFMREILGELTLGSLMDGADEVASRIADRIIALFPEDRHWLEVAVFTVPGAPVSKARPRTGQGRTYTPKTTLDAEEKIKWLFRTAPRRILGFPLAKDRKVLIQIDAHFKGAPKQDWDNIGKLVCDALNKLAYDDDSQIIDAQVRKFENDPNPRTVIRLFVLDEERTS